MIIYPKKTVKIRLKGKQPSPTIQVARCDDFASRLTGLMFQKTLDQNFGLLFDFGSETRFKSSIHMIFVFVDLTILWLDSNFNIVEKAIANKMHGILTPSVAARYVLELHSNKFQAFSVGDVLELVHEE